ncbi:MAG: hypothetical protein Q8M95_14720 [Candidatus Methanoperedens sp.]|nr:hypothetical protein [Candidatus Methanoperedens sp.]
MDEILKNLSEGRVDVETAKKQLRLFALHNNEKACLDVGRACRKCVPEVVLAEGKTPEDAARFACEIAKECGISLVTRANAKVIEEIRRIAGELIVEPNIAAKTVVLRRQGYKINSHGTIGVIAAGTADIPVAEEASVAAEIMGCRVIKGYDVGVAGIHRLFSPLSHMLEAGVSAIVVAAGMLSGSCSCKHRQRIWSRRVCSHDS